MRYGKRSCYQSPESLLYLLSIIALCKNWSKKIHAMCWVCLDYYLANFVKRNFSNRFVASGEGTSQRNFTENQRHYPIDSSSCRSAEEGKHGRVAGARSVERLAQRPGDDDRAAGCRQRDQGNAADKDRCHSLRRTKRHDRLLQQRQETHRSRDTHKV